MMHIYSNSKEISRYIKVYQMSEESFDNESSNGVYLGRTFIYNVPFLLNVEKLVNPHISIIGMTGSGKTYLLKSLILRHRLLKSYNLLVIDWNAEYDDVISFLDGETYKIRSIDEILNVNELVSKVTSVDLSGLSNDRDKCSVAANLIENILVFMHNLKPDQKINNMIIVDEAWKLLNVSNNLGKLFREARKYGFSIITATQLVKDVNNEVLANAACNIVFRTQGQENLNVLMLSGVVDSSVLDIVQKLKRGSCFISLSFKDERMQKRFVIDKIDGFTFENYFIKDDGMITKVPKSKLVESVDKLKLGIDAHMQLLQFFDENEKKTDLRSLVLVLIKLGLDRASIIFFCRSIGIVDLAIAKTYDFLTVDKIVRQTK